MLSSVNLCNKACHFAEPHIILSLQKYFRTRLTIMNTNYTLLLLTTVNWPTLLHIWTPKAEWISSRERSLSELAKMGPMRIAKTDVILSLSLDVIHIETKHIRFRTAIFDSDGTFIRLCFRRVSQHKHTRVYPKVSGMAAWSENCKW
jgi:hypothetical protein